MKVKVYKLGGCDWVAAHNKHDALKLHRSYAGLSPKEHCEHIDGYCEPLTDEQMENHLFYDTDQYGNSIEVSFKERLDYLIRQKTEFPEFFASTEY